MTFEACDSDLLLHDLHKSWITTDMMHKNLPKAGKRSHVASGLLTAPQGACANHATPQHNAIIWLPRMMVLSRRILHTNASTPHQETIKSRLKLADKLQ
jgi:hypothetical protein